MRTKIRAEGPVIGTVNNEAYFHAFVKIEVEKWFSWAAGIASAPHTPSTGGPHPS